MSPEDAGAIGAAVTLTLGGLAFAAFRLGPRMLRRRERVLAERGARAAETKGSLDDLMGVAAAAGVEPTETCDVPDARPLEPIADWELELLEREQARPWVDPEVTGWDPNRRTSTGMVRIGNRLIHPQCARARRDGQDDQICEYCRPAFAVGGATKENS